MSVECVVPILRVENLAVSLRFYERVLGLAVDWGGEPNAAMAPVSRGAWIVQEPTDRPWAYEMQGEDPDGHVLRCESEPRTTEHQQD